MAMHSVRNIINKSLSSSSKKQSNFKSSSPISSKSQSFYDENSPPIDPNIQVIKPEYPHFSNPKKSPSKLSISHSKTLEFPKPNPIDEHSTASDPPVKVIILIHR